MNESFSSNPERHTTVCARLWLGLLLATAAACTSVPLDPIPEPFPESAAWDVADTEGSGAFLGLKVRENDSGALDDLFFAPGVRVTRVVEQSPADRAGVQVGDTLLSFNGNEVNDPEALDAHVRALAGDLRVALQLQRGDSVYDVETTLVADADAQAADIELVYRKDPARSRAGWRTGTVGVRLIASAPSGPFVSAGVSLNAEVRSIDGAPVVSARELIRRLATYAPGAQIDVEFVGESGEVQTTRVTLQDQPTKLTGVSLPVLFTYSSAADGQEAGFVLLDLWFISLFRYRREGGERTYKLLRFITWSTGVGELSE